MCLPFRFRQADMGTANYHPRTGGAQCLTRNIPAPDTVLTGNSKYARSTTAYSQWTKPVLTEIKMIYNLGMSDVRNCRNQMGIVKDHGVVINKLSRCSPPRVGETVHRQSNLNPFTCISVSATGPLGLGRVDAQLKIAKYY
jgi:hypothetical protein